MDNFKLRTIFDLDQVLPARIKRLYNCAGHYYYGELFDTLIDFLDDENCGLNCYHTMNNYHLALDFDGFMVSLIHCVSNDFSLYTIFENEVADKFRYKSIIHHSEQFFCFSSDAVAMLRNRISVNARFYQEKVDKLQSDLEHLS